MADPKSIYRDDASAGDDDVGSDDAGAPAGPASTGASAGDGGGGGGGVRHRKGGDGGDRKGTDAVQGLEEFEFEDESSESGAGDDDDSSDAGAEGGEGWGSSEEESSDPDDEAAQRRRDIAAQLAAQANTQIDDDASLADLITGAVGFVLSLVVAGALPSFDVDHTHIMTGGMFVILATIIYVNFFQKDPPRGEKKNYWAPIVMFASGLVSWPAVRAPWPWALCSSGGVAWAWCGGKVSLTHGYHVTLLTPTVARQRDSRRPSPRRSRCPSPPPRVCDVNFRVACSVPCLATC